MAKQLRIIAGMGGLPCPNCAKVHDVEITQKQGHRSGGDEDTYNAAEPPWFTVDQCYRLTGKTQGTFRDFLSSRHHPEQCEWGHRSSDGTHLVHVTQLDAIIGVLAETRGREWRPE